MIKSFDEYSYNINENNISLICSNVKLFEEFILEGDKITWKDIKYVSKGLVKVLYKKLKNKIVNLSGKSKKMALKSFVVMIMLNAGYMTYTGIIDELKDEVLTSELPIIEEIKDIVDEIGFKDINEFSLRDEDIEKIIEHEGLRLKAYALGDGHITIGYGHAEPIKRSKYKVGDVISKDKALEIFKTDLKETERLTKHIFNQWKTSGHEVEVTQSMYSALVSIMYNVGYGKVRKSDLIKEMKKGNYSEVGEMIKTYRIYNKKFIKGLTERRKFESELFMSDLNKLSKQEKGA